jgi:hypothetical protein
MAADNTRPTPTWLLVANAILLAVLATMVLVQQLTLPLGFEKPWIGFIVAVYLGSVYCAFLAIHSHRRRRETSSEPKSSDRER